MNNFLILLGSMVSSKNRGKSHNKGKAKRALVMAALASCGLRAGKVLATPRNSPRITRASGRVEEGAATAASSSSAAAVAQGVELDAKSAAIFGKMQQGLTELAAIIAKGQVSNTIPESPARLSGRIVQNRRRVQTHL